MNTALVGAQAPLLAEHPDFRRAEVFEELPSQEDLTRAGISNLISFGLRQIVPRATIQDLSGSAVNIHISMLPWNRGSDPNFWSWFDATPKGVSIHLMEEKIDRGRLFTQREVGMTTSESLDSSYEKLVAAGVELIAECWGQVLSGSLLPYPQRVGGSYHSISDFRPLRPLLREGWKTPCEEIENWGRLYRADPQSFQAELIKL